MNQEQDDEIILKRLHAEGFAQVQKVIVENGTDSTGGRALFIWILVEDKVKDGALNWASVKPMIDVAFSAAQKWVDMEIWPYIRVRRIREYAELLAV